MKHSLIAAGLLTCLCLPVFAYGGEKPGRMLKHMDTDGNGLITLDEFGGRDRGMLEAADADGDGAVTLAEMKAHRDAKRAEHKARAAEMESKMDARMDQMFAAMDIDGDGAVTPLEAKQAMFNRLDADGDGYVSPAELRAGRDRDHRGGHGRDHDRPHHRRDRQNGED